MDRKISKSSKKKSDKEEEDHQFLQKASYIVLIKPNRFINPFRFYKISNGALLAEIERKIILTLDCFLHNKIVNSVEVNYPKSRVVTAHFSEQPGTFFTPCEYLIARLKSFGESDLYDWAIFLETYVEDYKNALAKFKQDVVESPSTIDCLEEDEMFHKYLDDKFGITCNLSYTEDAVVMESMSISTKLLTKLEYDREAFIKSLLEENFPKIYCPNKNYSHQARTIFKKAFCCDFKKFSFAKNMDLYNSKGELVPSIQKSGCLVLSKKGEKLYVKHYLTYDFHVEEEDQKESKMMVIEENPEFANLKSRNKQETIEFLKIYYGYKSAEDINSSKICTFRVFDE